MTTLHFSNKAEAGQIPTQYITLVEKPGEGLLLTVQCASFPNLILYTYPAIYAQTFFKIYLIGCSEDIRDVHEDNVPHQKAKQSGECRAFSVNACRKQIHQQHDSTYSTNTQQRLASHKIQPYKDDASLKTLIEAEFSVVRQSQLLYRAYDHGIASFSRAFVPNGRPEEHRFAHTALMWKKLASDCNLLGDTQAANIFIQLILKMSRWSRA